MYVNSLYDTSTIKKYQKITIKIQNKKFKTRIWFISVSVQDNAELKNIFNRLNL